MWTTRAECTHPVQFRRLRNEVEESGKGVVFPVELVGSHAIAYGMPVTTVSKCLGPVTFKGPPDQMKKAVT